MVLRSRMVILEGGIPAENTNCICDHGLVDVITSGSEENKGRLYARCPCDTQSCGCRFWCWVDEILMCPCGCGPCRLMTSGQDTSNGRRFYRCPHSTQEGTKISCKTASNRYCNFFMWKNEQQDIAVNKNTLRSSTRESGPESSKAGECRVFVGGEGDCQSSNMKLENVNYNDQVNKLLEVELLGTQKYLNSLSELYAKIGQLSIKKDSNDKN